MNRLTYILLALSLAHATSVQAAVSEEEAARLGQDLTAWGAVASANSDGSIPAYTGPLPESKWPEGATVNRPPNPFADEKPLYTIDQSNLDEYRELLSPGTAHLVEKYGEQGYKIHVYPSHRTMSFPDWIVENIEYNATHTELAEAGQRLNDVRPGPPFPIPQNGLEVLWNHLLRWEGRRWKADAITFYVDENGNQVLTSSAMNTVEYPFYNPDIDYGSKQSDFWYIRLDYMAPARRAGEKLLVIDPMDFTGSAGRRSWQYLKGQRRVRRAPAVAFDTPNPGTAGLATYDDAFMFNGSPERYEWKLIGKKELIIPYHNYDLNYHLPKEQSIGEKFIVPETQRWEKHRVWHVEATLKDGARHIYHRRTLYFDEDTLGAVISDQYDAQGELWRTLQSIAPVNYPLGAGFIGAIVGYDFNSGIYYMSGYAAESTVVMYDHTAPIESPSYYTSQGLARGGVR
jgi:hypothetical protein